MASVIGLHYRNMQTTHINGYREGFEALTSSHKTSGGPIKDFFGLVVALRPQTPTHIRGGWSHYTDTSEPVDGGVQL
jgi:hypothetical protein